MSKALNQRILDTVAAHLLKQGKKSTMDHPHLSSQCAYRGEEGTKCAIGCLISDEYYTPSIEGRGVGSPDISVALDKSLGEIGVYGGAADVLHRLQVLHDFTDPEDWAKALESLAKLTYLDVPACVTAALTLKKDP
jgi:hypothetical protein